MARVPLALGSALAAFMYPHTLTGIFASASANTIRKNAALLPAYFLFGIGFGMVNPPITNTAVMGMPEAQAGVAAAVASTSRQVGQTLGVAVAGAIAGVL